MASEDDGSPWGLDIGSKFSFLLHTSVRQVSEITLYHIKKNSVDSAEHNVYVCLCLYLCLCLRYEILSLYICC